MINNTMNSNFEPVKSVNNIGDNDNTKKDISAQNIADIGIYYSSVVKISDPNNGEVFLHMRGDE